LQDSEVWIDWTGYKARRKITEVVESRRDLGKDTREE
jgi:hypothetical protein